VESAGGAGDFLSEIARGDGQPLSPLAVEHDLVEIAFDSSEENIVESGDAHRVVRGPGGSRAVDLWELYCFLDAFGNVKRRVISYSSCFVVTRFGGSKLPATAVRMAARRVYDDTAGRLS
jgi:hypothetical protein